MFLSCTLLVPRARVRWHYYPCTTWKKSKHATWEVKDTFISFPPSFASWCFGCLLLAACTTCNSSITQPSTRSRARALVSCSSLCKNTILSSEIHLSPQSRVLPGVPGVFSEMCFVQFQWVDREEYLEIPPVRKKKAPSKNKPVRRREERAGDSPKSSHVGSLRTQPISVRYGGTFDSCGPIRAQTPRRGDASRRAAYKTVGSFDSAADSFTKHGPVVRTEH